MNSTVKRYAFRLSQLSEVMGGRLEVVEYSGDGLPYVLATDYDALETECERWKYRCQYNANTAHEVAAERDALAAELAAIKGQEVVDCKVVPVELLEQIAVELEHDNDRYFLGRELRAILEAKDE